ncbi:MAG: hypothetical protein AB7J35_17285 [Dehalococcoidia bacterium]
MGEWPPRYADARTLEGKLQRGLGSGFLEALDAPRAEVHAILLECIKRDPRWDHQVDDRGSYYGELALRLDLPVTPVVELLRSWGAQDDDGDSWVAVDVLQHLANRGSEAADAAIRDYVAWGPWWDSALYDLRNAAGPEWLPLIPGLIEKARTEGTGSYFGIRPPFSDWASLNAQARNFVSEARANEERFEQEKASWKLLSTEELLKQDQRRPHPFVSAILGERTSPVHQTALRNGLLSDSPVTRGLAALALARQGEFHLDVATELAVKRKQPPWASSLGRDALALGDSEIVLPMARSWRSARNWRKQGAAREILKHHATVDDIPWIEDRLRRCSSNGQIGPLRQLAEVIAARFPGREFPLLKRRFDPFTYSYGRRFLAQALAVTDPTFATTRAFTSLWDCEGETRLVAAEHVDLSVAGAVERLREMAADPLEDERVVEIATKRLETA